MAKFTCPGCHYTYWCTPTEGRCTNCGYHFDYLNQWKHLTPGKLKVQPQLVQVRSFLFGIIEKDDVRKGAHAMVTVTNRGLMITVIDKFQNGILRNRRWVFKEPQVFLLPYGDILSIQKELYQGKPAGFYTYYTRSLGVLRLVCMDGNLRTESGGSEELKKMVEQYKDAV